MMREKIDFYRVTVSQDSNTGNLTNTETLYYSPKGATVKEIKPSLDVLVGQERPSTLIQIMLRYNPETPILQGDKIYWRGFKFNAIQTKIDPLRRYIYITANSEIETTDRNGTQS
jgi:hypothetical protein